MKLIDYIDSHRTMLEIAGYHYQQIELLNSKSISTSMIVPITAHFNGMLTSYQNCLDIIAHAIVKTDGIKIDSKKVYFSNVTNKITSKNIKEIADKIIDSSHYNYIKDYSNTIKHNHLIDIDVLDGPVPSKHLYPSTDLNPTDTYVIRSFNKGSNYHYGENLMLYAMTLKEFFDEQLIALKESLIDKQI